MIIPPFSTPGRFWRGNLHAHSTLSDGARGPEEVVAAYRSAGYDFAQLSDHFLGRFGWPIADTRGLRADGFTTLIGGVLHAMGTAAFGMSRMRTSGTSRAPNRLLNSSASVG